MVLLWKDPEGKSVSTMNNSPPPAQKSMDGLEIQRIASLEKTLNEKDGMIIKLRDEIQTLKEVRFILMLCLVPF